MCKLCKIVHKTPGCDGLTPKIYLVLWEQIGKISLDALNHAYETGKLHLFGRRGIISLIPKKVKDNRFLKNWRPLPLLNTDYKILAKIVALRMEPALDKIMHSSQTGFMKNRNISHDIRKIIAIIKYTEQEQIDILIISLDFEKAFDRVEQSAKGSIKIIKFWRKFNQMDRFVIQSVPILHYQCRAYI